MKEELNEQNTCFFATVTIRNLQTINECKLLKIDSKRRSDAAKQSRSNWYEEQRIKMTK